MVNNKTGAVITAACCSTTGIGHDAHAASSLCLARDDRVGTVFVDDWPKNSKALELLLPGFNGRLDVWHVMARITDELRDGHTDYGAALRALSHVFFDWDRSDIAAVEVVLRNGPLNSHQYTREQIQATKDRGTFIQRKRAGRRERGSATRGLRVLCDMESPVHSLPGVPISILTPWGDMDNQWKVSIKF